MRDVGLAAAMLLALAWGWRLMGRLNAWLQSGRVQNDDEERQEDHPGERSDPVFARLSLMSYYSHSKTQQDVGWIFRPR